MVHGALPSSSLPSEEDLLAVTDSQKSDETAVVANDEETQAPVAEQPGVGATAPASPWLPR